MRSREHKTSPSYTVSRVPRPPHRHRADHHQHHQRKAPITTPWLSSPTHPSFMGVLPPSTPTDAPAAGCRVQGSGYRVQAAGCRAGRAVPDLFLGTRCCPGAATTRSCRWRGCHPRKPSCCWRSPRPPNKALRCSDAPLSPVNRITLPPSACLRLRLIASSPVLPLPAAQGRAAAPAAPREALQAAAMQDRSEQDRARLPTRL